MTRSYRQRLAASLATAGLGVACLGAVTAPATAAPVSSPAQSASAASGSVPVAARVTKIEHPAFAPVRESVSTFLAKAVRAGHPVTAQTTRQLTMSPASVSCWYWDDWRKASNIFGNTLWQFNVEPNWCGDGRWIRSYAYTNTWGSTPWIGWEYKGVIQSSSHWGVNWNVYEAIRQGSFCYIHFYGCVQNSYPYVDVEVGAGGQIYKS